MEERSGVLMIAVPYDSGHPFLRMGADPGTLLENGLGEALLSEGRGPSLATVRHEIWSADVRHLDMVDEDLVGSKAYAVTVMDNYSRVVLSSAVTRRQDLSAYEVNYDPPGGGRGGRLLRVGGPTLFETPFAPNQMRLFGLAETLGDDGWLRALRLEDYTPRRSRHPELLKQALFAYTDAI